MLYPWLTLMYCVKVEKVWDYLSMKQLLVLSSGYRSWEHLCVTKMKHSLTIWFCRDELSFAMLFWEDIIALLVYLKYYYFLWQYELFSWIFRIWIFIPQLRRITLKLCQVAGIKLGDANTSPTYLEFLIAPCYIIYCFGLYWALFSTFILFLGLTY